MTTDEILDALARLILSYSGYVQGKGDSWSEAEYLPAIQIAYAAILNEPVTRHITWREIESVVRFRAMPWTPIRGRVRPASEPDESETARSAAKKPVENEIGNALGP